VQGKKSVFERDGCWGLAWGKLVREAKQEYWHGQYSQAGCSIIRIEPSYSGYRSRGSSGFPGVHAKIAHYGKTGNGLARVVQVLKVPPLGDVQQWSGGGEPWNRSILMGKELSG
jgi:hypothetical protein